MSAKTQDVLDMFEQDEKLIAEAEKFGVIDFIVAGMLAAAVFVLQKLWEFPGIPPSLWYDVAAASGVQPAASTVPGYWMHIAGWIYGAMGIEHANAVMRLLGHGVLAGVTILVYGFLRETLTFVMRARPQQSKRRKLVMRIAATIGAISFAAFDPVWSAGQFFCETLVELVLTVGAIVFFFAFLRKGTLKYSYVCAILLGLLIAESPAGIALLFTFLGLNYLVINLMPNLESPFYKPALIEVGKWHMTFFLMAAIIAGIAFNCVGFIGHDGLVPSDGTVGSVPLKYLVDYWRRLASAASIAGWILLLGFAFGPFVVSIVRFSSAADEENFLPYSTGIVFLFCGAVAFSQCASLPALWFWTYVEVHSTYLLSLCALMCVLTIASSLTILGVDSLCRDHGRLARRIYGEGEHEGEPDEERVMRPGLTETLRKLGIFIVPALLIAAVVPGRSKTSTRRMLAFIADTVRATVAEAAGVEYIFTDGNIDPALEIESAARGGSLKCISLLSGGPNSVWLRTRGMDNSEDKFSFEYDGAMGLRSWIRDKPESLKKCAVQVGFDLWKRDGKRIPSVGGLVSLPASGDAATRAKAAEIARLLCERYIWIYDEGIGDCTDKATKDAFFNVAWRLGRMCLYRSEGDDLAGDAQGAIANLEMRKNLENRNDAYQDMLRMVQRRSEQMQRRLTPREGLQLALARADFEMGKIYAETVLGADLENPDANFALAMYYVRQKQFTIAEEYLKRCLIRRPDQPAFYNDLAMVQLSLGKLDAAEINVDKALKLIPDSAAVLNTKKSILQAKEAKKNAKEKTAAAQ